METIIENHLRYNTYNYYFGDDTYLESKGQYDLLGPDGEEIPPLSGRMSSGPAWW
jgi:hypothetical protein